MFKIYCDICEKEILPKKNAGKRIVFERARVVVELMVAIDKVWNGGHICEACLLEVIEQGEKKFK